MHRNAEILEKRHERLEAIARHAAESFSQAVVGASDHLEREALRIQWQVWSARLNPVAKRVWNALCVAKGWRKA